jgi:uncharacterized membrane protein
MQDSLSHHHSVPGKTRSLGLDYNIASLLCYVPFGFIPAFIFLLAKPKEIRFVRFHAVQSLLFIGTMIGLSIVLTILSAILSQIPVIGTVFALLMIPISLLISVGSLVLMVVLILKAYNNQMWQLPIIGQHANRLSA